MRRTTRLPPCPGLSSRLRCVLRAARGQAAGLHTGEAVNRKQPLARKRWWYRVLLAVEAAAAAWEAGVALG